MISFSFWLPSPCYLRHRWVRCTLADTGRRALLTLTRDTLRVHSAAPCRLQAPAVYHRTDPGNLRCTCSCRTDPSAHTDREHIWRRRNERGQTGERRWVCCRRVLMVTALKLARLNYSYQLILYTDEWRGRPSRAARLQTLTTCESGERLLTVSFSDHQTPTNNHWLLRTCNHQVLLDKDKGIHWNSCCLFTLYLIFHSYLQGNCQRLAGCLCHMWCSEHRSVCWNVAWKLEEGQEDQHGPVNRKAEMQFTYWVLLRCPWARHRTSKCLVHLTTLQPPHSIYLTHSLIYYWVHVCRSFLCPCE